MIEVKTTNGSARTPFFLSRNECDLATERPAVWQIYRVHLFAKSPRILTITPPLVNTVPAHPGDMASLFLRWPPELHAPYFALKLNQPIIERLRNCPTVTDGAFRMRVVPLRCVCALPHSLKVFNEDRVAVILADIF